MNAGHKLEYLSAEYERGEQLEMAAEQKKAVLESELLGVEKILGADVARTKEDEIAVLTGAAIKIARLRLCKGAVRLCYGALRLCPDR